MKLPDLIYGNNKTRRQTVAFGGVNYSENTAEGQWEETENLGSGRWPALSPRSGRAVARECTAAPTALYAWEQLASVEGTGFYYGGAYIGEVSPGPKQMARVGDWIVIWPDKKYYNWKTGAFEALEVGFTMGMGMGSAVSGNMVAQPEQIYTWEATESEPVTYTGNWLGVTDKARPGIKYRYGTVSYPQSYPAGAKKYFYITKAKDASIETGAVGQAVLLDDGGGNSAGIEYWGKITAITTEEREYMPGVTRKYTTVSYEKCEETLVNSFEIDGVTHEVYGYVPVEKYGKVETGTISDWAYGAAAAITAAEITADLGDSYYQYRENPSESYVGAYFPLLNGPSLGSNIGTLVQIGDLFFYDATTLTAQRLTAIDRTYYTDHYYTASYTLQEVRLVEAGTNADPETVAASLGMEIGDRVRVSRGGVSVDTRIQDYEGSYTAGTAPGQNAATLTIRFTDSVAALAAEQGVVSIDRITDPDLDYICVHDNRLWGVHDNRIWCSKFGDPQNFDADTGTDADAWWAEVGSPGEWTGIVSYSGSVLAFKENLVHKVVGDLPSEFTVNTYHIAGIQPGSHGSAAIVNEVLYYKGTAGVYAYSGYTPSFISENFGERKYRAAVGGTDGVRYYLSMQDEAGAWQLFCYDTIRGIWLREDSLHAAAFSIYDGRLYCAAEELSQILTFGEAMERDIAWQAVSVPFYEGSFDRKLYTKLLVRAEMDFGSTLRVWVSYDGREWIRLYEKRANRRGVAILPVRPKRCDSFRMKIEGDGNVTLQGIAREVLTGSEV